MKLVYKIILRLKTYYSCSARSHQLFFCQHSYCTTSEVDELVFNSDGVYKTGVGSSSLQSCAICTVVRLLKLAGNA